MDRSGQEGCESTVSSLSRGHGEGIGTTCMLESRCSIRSKMNYDYRLNFFMGGCVAEVAHKG